MISEIAKYKDRTPNSIINVREFLHENPLARRVVSTFSGTIDSDLGEYILKFRKDTLSGSKFCFGTTRVFTNTFQKDEKTEISVGIAEVLRNCFYMMKMGFVSRMNTDILIYHSSVNEFDLVIGVDSNFSIEQLFPIEQLSDFINNNHQELLARIKKILNYVYKSVDIDVFKIDNPFYLEKFGKKLLRETLKGELDLNNAVFSYHAYDEKEEMGVKIGELDREDRDKFIAPVEMLKLVVNYCEGMAKKVAKERAIEKIAKIEYESIFK